MASYVYDNEAKTFTTNATPLEQAIADLQVWLKEDDQHRSAQIEIDPWSVRINIYGLFEKQVYENNRDCSNNLENTITTAITKALNAVRN